MRKFVLLTDSACDLPVEMAQKHHIDILCFKLALNGVGIKGENYGRKKGI